MKEIRYDPRRNEFDLSEINYFFNLALQVTKRCNLRCVHCCESDYVPEMDTSKIISIISEMANHGTKRVCVTGGEPTQRIDLEDILQGIKRKGINATLATNGFNLSKGRLDRLSKYISNIRLSLYGRSTIHDRITQIVGSQEKVIQTLENARELGIPAYICTSLMSDNLSELGYVIGIASRYGVEKVVTFSLIDKGKGHDLFDKQRVTNESVREKINYVNQSDVKIYWTDFTREGQCAIIQPNGLLFGTPYKGNNSSKLIIGDVLEEGLDSLWKKYPFKKNYATYYKEKSE